MVEIEVTLHGWNWNFHNQYHMHAVIGLAESVRSRNTSLGLRLQSLVSACTQPSQVCLQVDTSWSELTIKVAPFCLICPWRIQREVEGTPGWRLNSCKSLWSAHIISLCRANDGGWASLHYIKLISSMSSSLFHICLQENHKASMTYTWTFC